MSTLLFHRSEMNELPPKGQVREFKKAKKYFKDYPYMEYFMYSRTNVTDSPYKLLRNKYNLPPEKKLIGYYRISAHRKGPRLSWVEFKHHDDKTKSN